MSIFCVSIFSTNTVYFTLFSLKMSKLTRCSVFTENEIATLLSMYKQHSLYLNRKCDAYVSITFIQLIMYF